MRSGYVGIFGLTNTGKSTLLNTIVGQKISITAKKDQTTLTPVYGILTEPDYQMVFIDTPGIQKPHNFFDNLVQNNVKGAVYDLDVIIHLVDTKKTLKDDHVINLYKDLDIPVILAINKLDVLKKNSKVDEIIISFMDIFDYKAFIPLSSITKKNVNHLLDAIYNELPEGDLIFPEDDVTNQSMNKLICDIVREKTIYFTNNDVKSGFYVDVTHIEDDTHYIEIVVNKENHKRMIIGKDGMTIKKIKDLARRDLKRNYDLNIKLNLFVKIDENWKDNEHKVLKKAF